MEITLPLSLASIAVVLWLAWLTGVTPRWRWPWPFKLARRGRRQSEEHKFIEETVRRMEEDPRAVDAVYAQSQHHDSNPAFVLAVLALLLSAALAMPESLTEQNRITWLSIAMMLTMYVVMLFALFSTIIGVIAMARVQRNADLYAKVIDRYCERLRLPKRPR